MTRQAVEETFEEFIDDIIEMSLSEFDVVAALQGGSNVGSRLVSNLLKNSDRLNRKVIQPELADYRNQVTTQFGVLLDYAEDDGATFAEYRDAVLEHEVYYHQLRDDVSEQRREEIVEALLTRQRDLIEAAQPLVDSPESEFWAAAEDSIDYERATDLVEQHFTFTDPLREYPDAFRFDVAVDTGDIVPGLFSIGFPTVTIEYTDEVVRALQAAEATVVEQTLEAVDRRFA